LHAGLDPKEREFLLSLARNEPNWALLGIEHLEQLPGVRWKLVNLEQLAKANPKKLKAQAQELEKVLAKSTR
jgi:tRNA G46 methylase TrmB